VGAAEAEVTATTEERTVIARTSVKTRERIFKDFTSFYQIHVKIFNNNFHYEFLHCDSSYQKSPEEQSNERYINQLYLFPKQRKTAVISRSPSSWNQSVLFGFLYRLNPALYLQLAVNSMQMKFHSSFSQHQPLGNLFIG
jgi:hypothetical protein